MDTAGCESIIIVMVLSSKPSLTVILCTYNPVKEVLERVIDSLKSQTLPMPEWELVVVDNNSTEPVSKSFDFSWHINSKVVLEKHPGLTSARLKGIQESDAELVLFVDDDNILAGDYCEYSLKIADAYPQLGTWGGSLTGEFDCDIPDIIKRYLHWYAIRPLERDLWSNVPFQVASHPYGAGMCVRREVAERYAELVANDPLRCQLDRQRDRLWGGGDADINYTANLLGFGNGVFKQLHIRHKVSADRLNFSYLIKFVRDMTCSSLVLHWLWGRDFSLPSGSQILFDAYRNLFLNREERLIDRSRAAGRKDARHLIDSLPEELRQLSRPHLEPDR